MSKNSQAKAVDLKDVPPAKLAAIVRNTAVWKTVLSKLQEGENVKVRIGADLDMLRTPVPSFTITLKRYVKKNFPAYQVYSKGREVFAVQKKEEKT